MATITKEQKKQILIDTANHIISRDDTSLYSENLRELARIALASLEAKPVAIIDAPNLDYLAAGMDANVWPLDSFEHGDVMLYATPIAPMMQDPCSGTLILAT